MSDEVETIVCPECGERLFRTFRFCFHCGASQPSRRPNPVAPAPTRAKLPPPFPGVGGKIRPQESTTSPSLAAAPPEPPSAPETPSTTHPYPSADLRTTVPSRRRVPLSPKITGIVVVILLGVVALVAGLRQFPFGRDDATRKLVVTVDPVHWVDVDPRATFGDGREFLVLGGGPLRVRTSSGRPVLSNGTPLSLGNIGGDRIELKSASGVQTVTLVAR